MMRVTNPSNSIKAHLIFWPLAELRMALMMDSDQNFESCSYGQRQASSISHIPRVLPAMALKTTKLK